MEASQALTVPQPIDGKICSHCRIFKTRAEFHRHRGGSGGMNARCKECVRAYYMNPVVCARVKAKALAARAAGGGKWYSARIRHRYYFAKSRAKSRGFAFALSYEQYQALTARPCLYCGGPLPLFGSAVDRADNALGYTETNAVPCCGECNRIKSAKYTRAQMARLGQVLREIREESQAIARAV